MRYPHYSELDLENVSALDGDASVRKYFRGRWRNKRVVVCFDPNFHQAFDNDFIQLQTYFQQCMLPVPEIYHTDQQKQLIYQEDLGAQSLHHAILNNFSSEKKREKILRSAIDLLIKIQQTPWPNYRHCKELGTETYLRECNWSQLYFLQFFRGLGPSPLLDQHIAQGFFPIFSRLGAAPKVLAHRDFHSKNLMVRGDKIVMIDFQDACLAPPTYDLCSLLHDSYIPMDEALRMRMLLHYYNNFYRIAYPQTQWQDFIILYASSLLQRSFKVLGTFTSLHCRRGLSSYLTYVGPALHSLLWAIGKLPTAEAQLIEARWPLRHIFVGDDKE